MDRLTRGLGYTPPTSPRRATTTEVSTGGSYVELPEANMNEKQLLVAQKRNVKLLFVINALCTVVILISIAEWYKVK